MPFTPVPSPQPRDERASTSRARLASLASLWAATEGSLPAASRMAGQSERAGDGGRRQRTGGGEGLLGLVAHGHGELVAAVDHLSLGGERLDVGLRRVGGGVGGLGAGEGGGGGGPGHLVRELPGQVGLLERVGERLLGGPELHPGLGGAQAMRERGGPGLGEQLIALGLDGGLAVAREPGEVPALHERGLAHVLPLTVEGILGGPGLHVQGRVRDDGRDRLADPALLGHGLLGARDGGGPGGEPEGLVEGDRAAELGRDGPGPDAQIDPRGGGRGLGRRRGSEGGCEQEGRRDRGPCRESVHGRARP